MMQVAKGEYKFYAHSTTRADRVDWQGLADHLRAVGDLAAQFARPFGGVEMARAAGLLHDLGKYTREFQRRISGENIPAEHSTHGAQVAVARYGRQLGMMLAYVVAGHHAGLANGAIPGERTALSGRLTSGDLPELLDDWQQEVALPAQLVPPMLVPHVDPQRAFFQLGFCTRMLFSCLVDADFLDTEAFYDRAEGRTSKRRPGAELTALRSALDEYLGRFRADSEVNRLRAQILAHVRGQAELATGQFSLTVPTGGGKTLASLAFALDHAIRHGLQRIIYVIPFTSIVEQNAAVFRQALGQLGESAVLEHHSAFEDETLKGRSARDKLKLAMENWDVPIIVTTAVQFFESLFAARTSRCRKLHNIAGSVVILDEAQTLPLKLLRPCVAAIDELTLNYRTTVVLCTATQPALQANDADPARSFAGGLRHVRELAPDPTQLYRRLERVRVCHAGSLGDQALAERMRQREQVLCIVNNRRHARALFDAIADQPGARHLTTLMCAAHRRLVLDEVRDALKRGGPCRLVSTSLIEAGVDVDFPHVLRAEAGLDSIAQAAGRCNREGRRAFADSEVHIFAAEGWASPPELRQYAQAMRAILRQHSDDPLGLDAIDAYFRELYWQRGAQALDEHDILGLFRDGRWDGMPFEIVADKFRMIDSRQRPLIIPFDPRARDNLARLAFAEYPGELARRLQPYTVQLPHYVFDELYKAGAIQAVNSQRMGQQFMMLVNEDLYDRRFGLRWDNPTFVEAEKTVW